MSYDEKCYDLAVAFLPVTVGEKECEELARMIQDVIEDYLVEKGLIS